MSWLGGLASCAINPVPQASWSGWPQLGCLRRPLCCPSWHKDICLYVSCVPMLYNSDFSFGKTIFWRTRFDYAEWCINGGFLPDSVICKDVDVTDGLKSA